jgi:GR25 family glycosyltransferase involved in LPS biosynthesis
VSFNFFDKVYCIHLPNQRERKTRLQKQFDEFGVTDVTFVSATPPPAKFKMSNMRRNSRGEMGVNLSQIKAVIQALDDGAETPLFLEDDIEFNPNTKQILASVFNELPSEWGVLYLGGHPRGPVPARQAKQHSEHLWKIQRHSFADGYCIKRPYLRSFFEYWCENITQDSAMYDFILGEFAGKVGGYAIYPTLVEQYAGHSSVTGQHDDKSTIVPRAWASHIGPTNLTNEHRTAFNKWRKKNPGRWEQSLKNMARKK